jgi:hypothetical protein
MQTMKRRNIWHMSCFRQRSAPYRAGILLLCLLTMLLAACNEGNSTHNTPHQTLQMDNGNAITYSTGASDVLVRLFYGGGKVGTLELTPEISLYGNGTLIVGPGLQPQQGALSSDALQNLLHTLTSTDNLLQLHRQVFNDIPNQNAALLQIMLNDKKYQFVYGPFGHVQEGSQDLHEYQQLGDAISAIKSTLSHTTQAYSSQQSALLVYQTFRKDFTSQQTQAIPRWTLTETLNLAHAAVYECGVVPADFTSPNSDLGCLHYTIPQLAVWLNQQNTQLVGNLLHGTQQKLFQEDGSYYIVMLRPLLPDEIAQQQLAMYGNNNQDYTPVPLKSGPIPVPTVTPRA